jgi:hypothetical protein
MSGKKRCEDKDLRRKRMNEMNASLPWRIFQRRGYRLELVLPARA